MRALLLIMLVGCARGGAADPDSGGGGNNDGRVVTIDSSGTVVDGPSGPQMRTLTQTTSQTIRPVGSIRCGNVNTGTRANNYYRVFDLAAMGITTDFAVTQVSFQVEHCDRFSGAGCATVAVRVGTYNGTPGATLVAANMAILASNATVTVPEVIEDVVNMTTPGGTVNAPITATIPAGQKLLVQVDAPDGNNVYDFFMGANNGGESGFGYILGPACNITVPTNISTVASTAPAVHLLLTVTGTY